MIDLNEQYEFETYKSVEHLFVGPPKKYSGYWDLPEFELQIMTEKKPSLWKRFWVFVFFGIKWKKKE